MKLNLPAILLCCLMLSAFRGNSQPGNGNSSDRMFFRAKLYAANGNIVDGNMVVFDDDLYNGYDGNDAVKMMNPGPNFGMRRDGRILAVEARNIVTSSDTIYYDLRNLQKQVYQIKFAAQYMTAVPLQAVLLDNFTNTEHNVSLTDSTFFFFTVDTDPASSAFDRFKLVFRSLFGAPLPVTFRQVKAGRHADKTISVQWQVEEEMNVDHYRIERSSNGTAFTMIGRQVSRKDIAHGKAYKYTDHLPLSDAPFYRIVGVDMDGRHTYSKIVKPNAAAAETAMQAYPNPLTGPQLQVRLEVPAGTYDLALSAHTGQKVFTSRVRTQGGSQLQSLPLGKQVLDGVYTLTLTGENGTTITQQLVINR